MAANSALRDENEALASLMSEVHSLADQWQEVWSRAKLEGKETVAAELQELRKQREALSQRLKALEKGKRPAEEAAKPRSESPSRKEQKVKLESLSEESQVLHSQNRELKEAIAQARAAIARRL
ncbi:unnamed protein product, partial [Symbiodinium pilosum]